MWEERGGGRGTDGSKLRGGGVGIEVGGRGNIIVGILFTVKVGF
jgi:hypothetical protein